VDHAQKHQPVGEVKVSECREEIGHIRLNPIPGGIIEGDWNQEIPIIGLLPPGHSGD
jgi:hypothetical protein